MNVIAILVITVFMSDGNVSSTATPMGVDTCRTLLSPLVAKTYKQKPWVKDDQTIRITYVEGYCHRVTEGQHV